MVATPGGPAGVATVFLIYVAAWAAIGLGVEFLMARMMVSPSCEVAIAAIAIAVAYTLAPWSTWARARCREMSATRSRGVGLGAAAAEGLSYSVCCAICSAGVMGAVVVLGMTNIALVVGAAAVMLAAKLMP